MDTATLTKWKQLANDAVIATFGEDGREPQLAQALEQAVETLEGLDDNPHCVTCRCYDEVVKDELV